VRQKQALACDLDHGGSAASGELLRDRIARGTPLKSKADPPYRRLIAHINALRCETSGKRADIQRHWLKEMGAVFEVERWSGRVDRRHP